MSLDGLGDSLIGIGAFLLGAEAGTGNGASEGGSSNGTGVCEGDGGKMLGAGRWGGG